MPHLTVFKDIAAAPEAVWALLADFGNLAWIPGATNVEVEGDGPGMRRKVPNEGSGPVVETLVWIRPEERRLAYEVANIPIPVSRFASIASVSESGNGRGCRIGWEVDYEPSGEDAGARESIELIYEMMAGWLEDAATASSGQM